MTSLPSLFIGPLSLTQLFKESNGCSTIKVKTQLLEVTLIYKEKLFTKQKNTLLKMSEQHSKLIEVINHYQNALNRYVSRGEEHKILHCLNKLKRLPIMVSHLEETGVGRSVNSLRKVDGEVGEEARELVHQWKEMVENDPHRSSDKEDEEEKEKCTESDENPSQNDNETSNLNANEKKSSLSSKKEETENTKSMNDGSSSSNKSNQHYNDKDKNERRHESSGAKHDKSSNGSHKSSNKSSKRKYEESTSTYQDENSENSEDPDDKNKRRSNKHSRENSPKSKKHKESEHSNKNKEKYYEKTEGKRDKYKEKEKSKKDSKDKHKDESPKLKENGYSSPQTSHKKDRDREKQKSGMKETSSKSSNKLSTSCNVAKEDKTKESTNSSESKKEKHSPTKSSSKSSNCSKNIKEKLKNVDSIDSGSGASFAEALGMLEPPAVVKSAKKKPIIKKDIKSSCNSNLNTSTSSSSSSSTFKRNLSHSSKEKDICKDDSSHVSPMKNIVENVDDDNYLSEENDIDEKMELDDVPALLANPQKLEPLEINISSLLPSITPNYRPVANNPLLNDNPRHKALSEYESLSNVISSKNARTKVYSGNKVAFGKIPSLFELCTRVLMDNIDALEYTGGVPYMILKPVLDKCTADQLLILEHFNPYLIEDTDGLWNFHCQKEFRNKKREEWESWREMYIRCVDEREVKLRALTANIKQSQDKIVPVRQTKLAYVDSTVKPPRSIARKQQRNGYVPDSKSPLITPSSRLSAIVQSGSIGQVSVPNPGPRAAFGASSTAVMKIKKAPLMQKTLQLMKGRFRR